MIIQDFIHGKNILQIKSLEKKIINKSVIKMNLADPHINLNNIEYNFYRKLFYF